MKKIALTLLALTYATRLFAQTPDPSPSEQGKTETQPFEKAREHHFWGRLHLTDDQKAKLDQIREADQDNIRSGWAQVAIARETLKAALLANPENTADIQAKATKLADALSTVSVQMALHRAKVNQVLTPAQRVALEEGKHRRMHHWGRHGREAERGPWQERGPWHRGEESSPESPAASPGEEQNPGNSH